MTTHRNGPASMSWDKAAFDAALRDAASDAERTAIREITAETRSIYDNADRYWPVKSGRSKRALMWRVVVSGERIMGEVRAGASYTRYISSAQIALGPKGIPAHRLRAMHAAATTPEQHKAIRLLAKYGDPDAAALYGYAAGKGGAKLGGKAARSGSAMWILLRWPEKAAGDRVTKTIGALIERDLARKLEG